MILEDVITCNVMNPDHNDVEWQKGVILWSTRDSKDQVAKSIAKESGAFFINVRNNVSYALNLCDAWASGIFSCRRPASGYLIFLWRASLIQRSCFHRQQRLKMGTENSTPFLHGIPVGKNFASNLLRKQFSYGGFLRGVPDEIWSHLWLTVIALLLSVRSNSFSMPFQFNGRSMN